VPHRRDRTNSNESAAPRSHAADRSCRRCSWHLVSTIVQPLCVSACGSSPRSVLLPPPPLAAGRLAFPAAGGRHNELKLNRRGGQLQPAAGADTGRLVGWRGARRALARRRQLHWPASAAAAGASQAELELVRTFAAGALANRQQLQLQAGTERRARPAPDAQSERSDSNQARERASGRKVESCWRLFELVTC
jgi:hypothetical protein